MKKLLIMILTLIMAVAMVSCGGGSSDSGSADDAATISVTIDIDFPDESGVADVDDLSIDVADGSSVLDVLNAYADANEGEIIMDESSSTPYVTSINGVAQTDTAGWVYEVNDEMVMESAGDYTVAAGDKIDWSFESWAESSDD
ncbi:MAG: DUF4430 domain-containing protein [Bacillota bacterium]|nr:DUF4430 domain-containing protein [Bacillota bacterium]